MGCTEDDCDECDPGEPDTCAFWEYESIDCGCFLGEHWPREGAFWCSPCSEHMREWSLYTPIATHPEPLRVPLIDVVKATHPIPPLK